MGELSVADVLDRAADLIEPEGAWTQGWTARTKDCKLSYSESSDAVCWCAGGAIVRTGDTESVRSAAVSRLRDVVGDDVLAWNDAPERTQAEVVSKLREAAALARESSK